LQLVVFEREVREPIAQLAGADRLEELGARPTCSLGDD
jgi:hypothetical protein